MVVALPTTTNLAVVAVTPEVVVLQMQELMSELEAPTMMERILLQVQETTLDMDMSPSTNSKLNNIQTS